MQKQVIAMKVEGQLCDWDPKYGGSAHEVLLDSPEGEAVLRHSLAHIMALALKQFDPDMKFAIGPAIDNGFYYDIESDREFSTDDLAEIEDKMGEIVSQNLPFKRLVKSRKEAIEHFEKLNQVYKVEILEGISENEVSFYQVGDFIDLCRGPHIPSTGIVPNDCFKLTKVAGAYWRGDSTRTMLQRIYGVAFASKAKLDEYLHIMDEAQRRDHRKIGPELGLFHIDEVAPGNVFWLPNGLVLFETVKEYLAGVMHKYGYRMVKTPQLLNKSLWETSGHWAKFRENMFVVENDDNMMAIKPMNCPGHIICFKTGSVKSYKDLPLRIGEFGLCHRNESSGSLHGVMRLRAFIQDDGHIFCAPEQIVSETVTFCSMLKEIYSRFGFESVNVKFSDRPERRVGDDAIWDLAEGALKDAATQAGLEYTLNKGEGAFYGPKLEFVLKDCIGREWQCGTLQVDFNLPQRFGIHYIDNAGNRQVPVMLHRAVVGSIERFVGILIENYAGKFPLWLAPVQMVVASVSAESESYAREVYERLKTLGYRAELDISSDMLPYKVRKYSTQKVPHIVIVGKKETENQSVSIRSLDTNKTDVFDLGKIGEYFAQLSA